MTDPRQRLRVTFLSGSGVVWGAETSMLLLAQALRAHVDISLICSNDQLAERWRAEVRTAATVVRTGPGRLSRLRGFVRPLRRIPKDQHVLVVYDFYLLPLVALFRIHFRRNHLVTVVDVHDSARDHPRRRPYFRLMQFVDGAIAISRFISEELPRGLPYRVVSRPVLRPSRVHAEIGSPPVIGIVGQVTPAKRVVEGIAILEHLGEAVLEVRGDAPLSSPYLDQVRSAGEKYGPRFTYRGRLPHDQVMDGLDFLLLVNPSEPFGRVVVEAQIAGVVPVVPDSGGSAELVRHGTDGLVYPALHLEEAAAAIERCSNSSGCLATMQRTAQAGAEVLYSPQRLASEYLDFLLELALHNSAVPPALD